MYVASYCIRTADLLSGGTALPYAYCSACSEALGCFDSELGPLSHVGTHPWPPEKIATRFLLFTPATQHAEELIDYLDPAPLLRSAFDPTLKTVFFSHGFGSSGNLSFVRQIKDAFFAAVSSPNSTQLIATRWSPPFSTHINHCQLCCADFQCRQSGIFSRISHAYRSTRGPHYIVRRLECNSVIYE